MSCVGLALGVLVSLTACQKQGAEPNSVPPGPGPGAARPAPTLPTTAPAPARRHLFPDCFDVYAECPPTAGLPAISADGSRLAVADLGPEDPRDEFVLTVRLVSATDGAVLAEHPIVTDRDHRDSADPRTGEFLPRFRPALDQRVAAFESAMQAGQFRPLLALGRVNPDAPGKPVAGLRAAFDGTALTVADVETGRELWRRDITARAAFHNPDGAACDTSRVADVTVWLSRDPAVGVARVAYVSSEFCTLADPYVIERLGP